MYSEVERHLFKDIYDNNFYADLMLVVACFGLLPPKCKIVILVFLWKSNIRLYVQNIYDALRMIKDFSYCCFPYNKTDMAPVISKYY